jgi:hypothetical protein
VLLAGADKFNKNGAKEGLAYLHQAGVVSSLTDPDTVAKYETRPSVRLHV